MIGVEGGVNVTQGCHPRVSMTLREESSGKKQGNVNAKTMSTLDHLKNLALWATTEASVPSLGAFFGERLATTNEALGLRADPSLFLCERCESILQPDHNCAVRIEKSKSKMQHRCKKSNLTTQNRVAYRCYFCSHLNLMRGTPQGYVKEICPPKAKPRLKSETVKSSVGKRPSLEEATRSIPKVNKLDTGALPTIVGQNLETGCPLTPLPTTGISLLDLTRRKRNRSGAKKVTEPESSSTAACSENSIPASSKRRKKSWTSLKEIAQCSGHDDIGKKLTKLAIPFFI